jgi:hypothetical protein
MMAVEKHSELREAWRAVAYAKLVEYRHQVWRLAQFVRHQPSTSSTDRSLKLRTAISAPLHSPIFRRHRSSFTARR